MSQPAPPLSIDADPQPDLTPTPVADPTAVLPAPAAGTTTPGAAGKSFLAHAKLVGGLTLVSRFAGLAREMVAANVLGTGLVAAAFTVAFTIPNLFRKLFGEGARSEE